MKKKTIITGMLAFLFAGNLVAQNDSSKTITTTTTITESNKAGDNNAGSNAAQQESSAGSSDLASFYIGARFMPVFTDFEVKTVSDDVAQTSFVVGYGAGGYIGVNLSKNIGLQGEVLYNALSQKYTDNSIEHQIDLTYLNIPLLLVFNTDVTKPVNFNICAGPQLGINLGSDIKTEGSGGVDTVTAVLAVKKGDIGFAYGAGLDFNIAENLTFGLGFRGVYGLVDISDNSQTKTTEQYYILDRTHIKTYAAYAGIALKF